MSKPIIGILAVVDDELNTKIQNTYINAIERAGGAPVLLPYVKNEESIDAFVSICDGFLFTGGADVSPARYGEEKSERCGDVQLFRDEIEFKAFDKIYPTGKPIMAICRGAQLLNVAMGGSLYQDIPSEVKTEILHRQSEPKNVPTHTLKVLPDTPLHRLISTDTIVANSFHHQAIKRLSNALEITALSEDGIIEAVSSKGERYIRAYQWHPELLIDTDSDNLLLFEEFISEIENRNP